MFRDGCFGSRKPNALRELIVTDLLQPTKRKRPRKAAARLPGGAPRSLRDAAYEAIKYRIITCVYKPGQYVNEAYLATELGFGRTPVHQALDRLMMEGLVSVLPRKGVFVKPVSLDEIIEIIDVRLLNEGYCARLAAERASGDDIARLSDILSVSADWVAKRDTEQLMRLDSEFHSVLAGVSGNATLSDVLVKMHDRSLRFWFLSLNSPGHHENVQRQHEGILAAIRDRDPDGAEQAMRDHIQSFHHNIERWR
jgi:DNA-binding GntR family transcriptional regulator